MAFEIDDFKPAKLTSVNVRSERHGEELVPAVDLAFSVDMPNDALSYFDGWLLTSLFLRKDPVPDQQPLEGVEQVSAQPNLRFPKLAMPLKWDDEYTGYSLEIDHGLGGRSNLQLADCKANKWRLTLKEGGTVEIGFRVQASGPALTEKVLGKLATLAQHDVTIKLLGPEPADVHELFKDSKPKDKAAKKNGRTPEQALADAVGAES